MAEPAREDAPLPGPGRREPTRGSDPNSPGWANVQRAMAACGRMLALSAAEAVSRDDDPILREMLQLAMEIAAEHGEIARRCVFDEQAVETERRLAYAQGYRQGVTDCKAARCNLKVIDCG